uniref:PH domain-containing protein n=1 Tax=Panagrolaimus sp. ES5 TaxID=591445 RepID=A0AC34FKY0_9BILA
MDGPRYMVMMNFLRERIEKSSYQFWKPKYGKVLYVALCIHDSKIPFLEWYDEKNGHGVIIGHEPLKVLDLIDVNDVRVCPDNNKAFIISFDDPERHPIEFLAEDYQLACYWVDELNISLRVIKAFKEPKYHHENCFDGYCARKQQGLPSKPPSLLQKESSSEMKEEMLIKRYKKHKRASTSSVESRYRSKQQNFVAPAPTNQTKIIGALQTPTANDLIDHDYLIPISKKKSTRRSPRRRSKKDELVLPRRAGIPKTLDEIYEEVALRRFQAKLRKPQRPPPVPPRNSQVYNSLSSLSPKLSSKSRRTCSHTEL